MTMLALYATQMLGHLRDPFGFAEPLGPLTLQAADLPGWSREARLEGLGA